MGYVLQTINGAYYTGKTLDWLSYTKKEAFVFEGLGEATRVCDRHNRYSNLHGLTFKVVEVWNAG